MNPFSLLSIFSPSDRTVHELVVWSANPRRRKRIDVIFEMVLML